MSGAQPGKTGKAALIHDAKQEGFHQAMALNIPVQMVDKWLVNG